MSSFTLRLALAVTASFCFVSCTVNSGKALTATDAARLRGSKLIVVATGDKPLICPIVSFGSALGQATVMMASAAVLSSTTGMSPGAAGGFVAGTAAHTPVSHGDNYGVIPNPMNKVSSELADQLVKQHGAVRLSGVLVSPIQWMSPKSIAKKRPDADFALVVASTCGATFQVHNPARYNIHGNLSFYLYDLKSRKTLATGVLNKSPGAKAPGGKKMAYKSSELVAPGSKLFEDWMNALVAEALPQFKSKLAGQ